jgi:hypothetical protein
MIIARIKVRKPCENQDSQCLYATCASAASAWGSQEAISVRR